MSDDDNRFKRINVKKIASLKDLFNKEISKVEFCLNDTKKINEILNLVKKEGKTEVKIKIKDKNENFVFILKNKRLVDRKSINMLKKQDILTTFY
jgi:DNA polymerase-3 subunit alpha